MRFVSRDGVVLGSVTDTQSLNRYAYVLNNPIHAVDPNGQWFGIDDLIMTIGGAVVGVVGQFASDVISSLVSSAGSGSWDFQWSGWEDYVGAAVGGAVGGETLLYTDNPLVAGAAGAAAGDAATQGLQIADGKRQSFDVQEFAANAALGAAFGGLGGLIALDAGPAVERGGSEMLKYIGKSWASRGLASSSKAALNYASRELGKELFYGSGQQLLTGPFQRFVGLLVTQASASQAPNPIRPENAVWSRMLQANQSTAIGIVGTVRPELLLRTYAPITATEGGR
jgi:hypothetical protein